MDFEGSENGKYLIRISLLRSNVRIIKYLSNHATIIEIIGPNPTLKRILILPFILTFQVLGGDASALHPLTQPPHCGWHDHVDLVHVSHRLAGAAFRLEGQQLRGQGRGRKDMHGKN